MTNKKQVRAIKSAIGKVQKEQEDNKCPRCDQNMTLSIQRRFYCDNPKCPNCWKPEDKKPSTSYGECEIEKYCRPRWKCQACDAGPCYFGGEWPHVCACDGQTKSNWIQIKPDDEYIMDKKPSKQSCVYKDRIEWLQDGSGCCLCDGPCKWKPSKQESERTQVPDTERTDREASGPSADRVSNPAPETPRALKPVCKWASRETFRRCGGLSWLQKDGLCPGDCEEYEPAPKEPSTHDLLNCSPLMTDKKQDKCPRCDGSGNIWKRFSDGDYDWAKCPDCQGTGKKPSKQEKASAEKAEVSEVKAQGSSDLSTTPAPETPKAPKCSVCGHTMHENTIISGLWGCRCGNMEETDPAPKEPIIVANNIGVPYKEPSKMTDGRYEPLYVKKMRAEIDALTQKVKDLEADNIKLQEGTLKIIEEQGTRIAEFEAERQSVIALKSRIELLSTGLQKWHKRATDLEAELKKKDDGLKKIKRWSENNLGQDAQEIIGKTVNKLLKDAPKKKVKK